MAGIGAFAFATGRIRWGYQCAALLTACRVDRDDAGGWTLHATVTEAHQLRIRQSGLTFEAVHARGVWTWPIDSIDLAAGACTARLSSRTG